MTQADIIQMAREAGLEATKYPSMIPEAEWQVLERFAKLVAEKEREELANKIARMPFGDTSASFAIWIREQQ